MRISETKGAGMNKKEINHLDKFLSFESIHLVVCFPIFHYAIFILFSHSFIVIQECWNEIYR